MLSITLLGYFLGTRVPWLRDNIDYAILAILALSVIPVAYEWIRHRRDHRHDDEAGREAATLAAARARRQLTSRGWSAGVHRVELGLGEHGAHLEADVGQRVLALGAAVDRADHDLDDRARLAQRGGRRRAPLHRW